MAVLTFAYQKTDEIPVEAAVEEDPSILIEKERIAAMEREAFDLMEKRLARQEIEIVEMNEKFEQQSKTIDDIMVRTFTLVVSIDLILVFFMPLKDSFWVLFRA